MNEKCLIVIIIVIIFIVIIAVIIGGGFGNASTRWLRGGGGRGGELTADSGYVELDNERAGAVDEDVVFKERLKGVVRIFNDYAECTFTDILSHDQRKFTHVIG